MNGSKRHRPEISARWILPVLVLLGLSNPAPLSADQRVILNSGITLQGLLLDRASLNENPFQVGGQGQGQARPILMVDDGLRRVYVHRRGMVAGAPQDVRGVEQTIEFAQKPPLGGSPVQLVGDVLDVTPFNQYGRRIITIRGPTGAPIEIVQGITELNARYAKVEALKSRPPYQWDMRVATKSIMPETFQQIFRQRVDQENLDDRLMVVRFFIESERFRAAEEELTRVIRAFPELENMRAQLTGIVERQAVRLIDEAILRSDVGQEQYARNIYERFPMDAVGRTTREKVKIAIEKLTESDRQVQDLIDSLKDDVQQLPEGTRDSLRNIVDEIEAGLSSATLRRLSDYSRLKGSETVALEERVALAVAGWLMGSGSGEQNLVVTVSLVKVRDLVAEYLGTADAPRRQQILEELKTLEGSQIEYVARLLPQLVPTQAWPEGSADETVPGLYRLGDWSGQGAADSSIEHPGYLVQLPPEYDPLREYPCLVVLSPPGGSPEAELAWWAGQFDENQNARTGHATRNGYIVVAPKWGRNSQRLYEYTRREHHAVLAALRHAMRRSSIDADRVFIAGHDEGATAAWDIALSHPDHWAGMVSINGEPSKTIAHYFPNARQVPMYFVMGESSGPGKPPLIRMGAVLDDYMDVNNDATVVMYRGRGREDFYEEIPQLFEWMNVSTHVRRPMPQDFEAVTMRTGDQYFWWLELGPLKPTVDLNPVLWDQEERKRSGKISAAIGGDNQVRASCPSDSFRILLRPDIGLDLNQTIIVNRTKEAVRYEFQGDLEPLLEDTRLRADRKRPFWGEIRVPEDR